jgi:hypothetical protein
MHHVPAAGRLHAPDDPARGRSSQRSSAKRLPLVSTALGRYLALRLPEHNVGPVRVLGTTQNAVRLSSRSAVSSLDRPNNARRLSRVGPRINRAHGMSSWADPPGLTQLHPLEWRINLRVCRCACLVTLPDSSIRRRCARRSSSNSSIGAVVGRQPIATNSSIGWPSESTMWAGVAR